MAIDLRATETAQLSLLLDLRSDVYIHGPSGSGKSTIARRVVKPRVHEWLNCAMISGLKQVLRHLIYHYQTSTKKISTPAQFFLQYMEIPAEKKQEHLILVLDHVDKLLVNERSALYTLHKLRVDCQINLNFLFISEVHFSEGFRHPQNVCVEFRPVPLFVPGMGKEEISYILKQEYRIEDERNFEEFLRTVYPVFAVFSVHVDMFRYIYEKLNLEFHQKTHQDFQKSMQQMCDLLFDRREKRPTLPDPSPDSQFLYKLLAVSSFICSHTSQKNDVGAFKRLTTARRQKVRQSKYLDSAIMFPYERLMAVFQVLHFDTTGEHYRDSPRLDATLGTLIEKKLLKAIQPGHLHCMKLLSFITFEDATALSSDLHLKLGDYIAE